MADNSMSIGEYLRRTRLSRRLDIAEISQELHIRREYLEALEHDDWDKLPGEVYGIGFLRSYARYLDVDADALANYRRRLTGQRESVPATAAAPPQEPTRRRHRTRVPPGAVAVPSVAGPTRSQRRADAPAGSGRVVLGAALVLLGLFAVGIFLLHNNPKTATTTGTVPSGTSSKSHSGQHPPKSVEPSSQHSAPPPSPAPVIALASNNPPAGDVVYRVSRGPLTVQLAFTGLCWVQVWINGVSKNPAGTTYHAGQTLSLSASSSVEVWVGTRAFTLTVDNQTVTLPDPAQRVLHVTFARS